MFKTTLHSQHKETPKIQIPRAGIALLGAGIFALQGNKTEHLPAIEASPALSLKAVYSRSQQSAQALAAASTDPSAVAVYFDLPAVAGQSLDDLLRRDDIVAVDIALPIVHQPAVVEKALMAGKHVLSEKPVAADMERAETLLAWYAGLGAAGRPLWAVAENFRFMESLRYATAQVHEIGGALVTFRLQKYGFIRSDNKYFNTEWRKNPQYQGGFLLDGGVHFIAGLRVLLAAAGQDIEQIAAFTGLLDARLIPVDTIHAVARTRDGKSGTIAISFGTEFKDDRLEVEVATTNGAVLWRPTDVTTVARSGDGKAETKREFAWDSGVKAEVAAFAHAIEAGEVDARQTPSEALKDLEILQLLLESGASGAAVKAIGATR
ncbi:NAD(P)-binding protein [Trichocladium antarcticum]|uniref:NAD(P)-binding protein n=1 Tax=Trichocladium antarcticum TaxID=1450529 RepID=A0AAN6ULU7_9PEZI|nr:NAD(P)-binding protein [Trichocladium antarcticum]